MKKFAELEKEYSKKQTLWKTSIRLETNRWKRFWKWIAYYITFPFVWIWINIRDWKTALIFVIVFLAVSSEVWVMYLLYFITKNNWFLAVGSACWLFWLGPGTPFMVIVVSLTIAIKTFFNHVKKNR